MSSTSRPRSRRNPTVVGAATHLLFYITIYPVLWLAFWPVRAYQTKNHPEEYEATRQKLAKKK